MEIFNKNLMFIIEKKVNVIEKIVQVSLKRSIFNRSSFFCPKCQK